MSDEITDYVSEAQTGTELPDGAEPILERLERLHNEGRFKEARRLAVGIKQAQGTPLTARDRLRTNQSTDSTN